MKKNQLTTTKSTALILGKSKSLMKITKKLLKGKKKELLSKSQDITAHKDITIIGELMWEKESRKMNWDDAMEYAKNLRLCGYADWRLPSKEELAEVVTLCGGIAVKVHDNDWRDIIDRNRANKAYQANYKAKGFSSSYYWSSTTYAGDTSDAWFVSFSRGGQSNYDKSYDYYVRCVRSGQ